jgi:AraC family transcriptional regulator, ethanolamine operon transcriptional activator
MNLQHCSLLDHSALEASYVPASVSWAQLEPGAFDVGYRVVDVPALRVATRRYNMALQVQAAVQSEKCVIIVVDEGSHARWYGTPFDSRGVAYTRSGLDIRTDGPNAFFSITLDERALRLEFANAPDAVDLVDGKLRGGVAQRDIMAARLRASVARVFEGRPFLSRMLSGTLIPLLATVFDDLTDRAVERPKSLNRRFAAVRKCETYMREHVDSTISLLDLSAVSGMRSRSLINAFEAVTGLSPMDHLKRLRLNGARRALQASKAGHIRVIDVATAWGFWHMGHFAADYRAMFGEAPSQTLTRP